MKRIITLLIATTFIIGCGNAEKKEETTEKSFSIKENTTILKWTAYKTTEKKPVGGEFTEVNLKNVPKAETPEQSLNGLTFGVPVSSIFTNNESRDGKLKEFFFGVMANTEIISGEFKNIEGTDKQGKGVISLTMNAVTCDLPFDYTIEGKEFKIVSELNIKSWKADAALDSLNNACYDLHKGPDGISFTSPNVSIDASVEFQEN